MISSPHFVDDVLRLTSLSAAQSLAVIDKGDAITYGDLEMRVEGLTQSLVDQGLKAGDRIAVRADKNIAVVALFFAVWRLGAILVPLNPALKDSQVQHILDDSGAVKYFSSPSMADWQNPLGEGGVPSPTVWHANQHENLAACILYTSGSTGKPKGVVLSHRNLLAGASSVATYLGNRSSDRLLAALPLSFDAGLSQITTGFLSAATVVLHHYMLAQDCLRVMATHQITGLTAVPPMWIQLAKLEWPNDVAKHLRYFANTGGRMPRSVLDRLRTLAPQASPFLMYGLTEAFRSTFLDPAQVDARPDSIGKAIPNAQVLVLRPDGSLCEPMESGELVHLGPTVTLGYWRDPQRTSERFKPITGFPEGLPFESTAVWSGDQVYRDHDGYLYFIGRTDEMIKTSGYRVSPTELEEVVYRTGLITECLAFGVDHGELGQAIGLIGFHPEKSQHQEIMNGIKAQLQEHLPRYMWPTHVHLQDIPFPRNANGKLDRPLIIATAKDLL
jgi:acyl-CoA ligase (AMP-forming) (exosortase A-associated)